MSSINDEQIGICLLKSNLEEIRHDLVVQRTAIPALEAENNKKCNETKAMLRVVRSLKVVIEMLIMENVRLTAKRDQLKRQRNELTESLEEARNNRNELTNRQKQEDSELEVQLGKPELEKKVKALTSEFEALSKKQKTKKLYF